MTDLVVLGTGRPGRNTPSLVVFHGISSLQVELCGEAAGFLLNAALPEV